MLAYRICFNGGQDVYVKSDIKPFISEGEKCVLIVKGARLEFWHQITSITQI